MSSSIKNLTPINFLIPQPSKSVEGSIALK